MLHTELRRQVLQYARLSYGEGLFAGTSGNLSARDPESGEMVITPSSIPYPSMEEADLTVVAPNGTVLEGPHKPSSEWRLHAELYRRRPDLHAVVHTHSPWATGFAAAGREIPAALIEMLYFLYGSVPVAAYATPGTPELGLSAVQALKRRTACLLESHGVVAVGATLEEAHLRAVYVEDAARICAHSVPLGGPRVIPAAEQNKIRRQIGIPEEETE